MRSATVGVTDLVNFAKGGQVEVVVHTENGSFFGAVGPSDYRADVVHRANWLRIPANLYTCSGVSVHPSVKSEVA
jgi:hypothetical protein